MCLFCHYYNVLKIMDTGDHIWQVEYGSEIVQFATANAATNSADKK